MAKKTVYQKARYYYTSCYENESIVDNEILIQAYNGTSVSGNPYYILQELHNNPKYSNLKLYVVSTWGGYNTNREFLDSKGYNDVELIKIHSEEYCKLLARAKYLVNNSTFAPYFIKKENQVYLNTWHGTPLKALGRSIHDAPNEIGNTQRNFMMSDYLLFPNEFTFEHMRNDYMLNNIFKGEYVISGYPRNSVFFDKANAQETRKKLKLTNKRVVAYMPTWRGNLNDTNGSKQYIYLMHTLFEIDERLPKDMVLYVKTHSLNSSKIDFNLLKNIRPFPDNFETYELLNASDCLITDYSSVFFDYATTGRKIILYGYDKDEYIATKGTYLDFDSLPFTFAYNPEELLEQLQNLDDYAEYSEFNKQFTSYDSIDASKTLCDLFINNNRSNDLKIINGTDYSCNKKNVLIFAGALEKNGITTALKAFVNNLDKEKYNYILTFYYKSVENNKSTIFDFGDIDYMPMQGLKSYTKFEAICYSLYYKYHITSPLIKRKVKKIFEREFVRLFYKTEFSHAIHYTGYEHDIMNVIRFMDAERILFIHNDMKKEEKTKGNFNKKTFKLSLEQYNKIVCIRDTSKSEILDYHRRLDDKKVYVAHNLNDIDIIKKKASYPLKFDNETYCNIKFKNLQKILEDDTAEIFVNIGRYSHEKGHNRLIDAFIKYHAQNPNRNSYLIIVGGNGNAFDEISEKVNKLNHSRIILVKHISNPYPILNRANLFILSSFYEGLPMTIMEALILNKPIISTNIAGPYEFLNQGYGHIVENSEEGLLQGMNDFAQGKITDLIPFDAEKFNQTAIEEIKALFD